jgi:hypothetical protein
LRFLDEKQRYFIGWLGERRRTDIVDLYWFGLLIVGEGGSTRDGYELGVEEVLKIDEVMDIDIFFEIALEILLPL